MLLLPMHGAGSPARPASPSGRSHRTGGGDTPARRTRATGPAPARTSATRGASDASPARSARSVAPRQGAHRRALGQVFVLGLASRLAVGLELGVAAGPL